MTPIYVSRANVETVIGITPHALVALAARYKLKAAKLTPRSRPVWLTTEVTAAIEAERASAAAVDVAGIMEADRQRRAKRKRAA